MTTIVPKGRGWFPNFTTGAIDAIDLAGIDKVTDWSIGNVLYILEGYNGFGYEKYHNIPSSIPSQQFQIIIRRVNILQTESSTLRL